MVTYKEKEFKTILNVRKSINDWFWDKYGINPYNGCQFGCIYCDSRSTKYYLPADFENNIIIKKNIDIILDKRIANARTLLPDVIGIGGTTDPYQAAETIYHNTRRCLEIIKKYKYPVHIATKSPLVLKDIDILEEIGKNNWCTISVTITTTEDSIGKFLEKRVVSAGQRFNIIKSIKKQTKNIQVGILFMPVVPYLCDSEKNIESVINIAKDSGADYVLFGGGMTMRDMQAAWFLRQLKKFYPQLLEKYEKLYGFSYNEHEYTGRYEPDFNFYIKTVQYFIKYTGKYNMARRIKRFIPTDYRKYNYIISEKLFNLSYERRIRGKYWDAFFWAAYNIQKLKESILNIAKRNELVKIKSVGSKISAYIMRELAAEL